jgi:hypothetical protein
MPSRPKKRKQYKAAASNQTAMTVKARRKQARENAAAQQEQRDKNIQDILNGPGRTKKLTRKEKIA